MGQGGSEAPARVVVGQLGLWVGDQVRVCGWVQTLRLQRRMQFVVLRDESGAVQLTNRRDQRPELDQRIDALTVGSVVALTVFEQRMRSFLLGRGFTELHTPS
jgi:aspartyl-tRNA synthetase